jgi:hypothetical protein
MSENKPTNMYNGVLSIDIEKGGCRFKDPMIAIGTCFIDKFGAITKKLFVFNFDFSQFEKRCVDQHWKHHMDQLDYFKNYETKSTIADFAKYLDELDTEYPNLIIIIDNPQFDIANINYLFEHDLDRKPMTYRLNSDNGYRVVSDVESIAFAICPESTSNWMTWTDLIKKYNLDMKGSAMDHYPQNDAEYILQFFLALKTIKQ